LADALSRAYISNLPLPGEKTIKNVNVFQFLKISDERIEVIAAVTRKDQKLQQLSKVILSGWPARSDNLEQHLRPYFHYRHELTIHNGLILKDQRIVVPEELRGEN
jgi:hypothetical protein